MKGINNYLDEEIIWKRAKDPRFPFSASYDGQTLILRLNDFPAEHLYTLITDGAEVDFDDWPAKWTRSGDLQKTKADIRRVIHSRFSKKVRGSAERPRLAVFRSLNHIYAKLIDDDSGKTLATASTAEKTLLAGKTSGNIEAAKTVGRAIAERAIQVGVSNVVYDRGGYVYHGRVKALLDATREAGLNKIDATEQTEKVDGSENIRRFRRHRR